MELTPEQSRQDQVSWTSENGAKVGRRALIEAAVAEICHSTPFRASRQSKELLSYIVTHTIAGDDPLLRERVIGMEVFARKPDYDTGEDPVVRLRASELRKRLAQFYQSAPTGSFPVQISIPAGSYRAHFVWPEVAARTLGHMEEERAPQYVAASEGFARPALRTSTSNTAPARRSVRRSLVYALWLGAVLLTGAACGFLYWRTDGSSDLRAFWGPVMDDPRPALVCIGSNAVYRLSNNFLNEYQKRTGKTHDGNEFLIDPVPGEKMDQRDLLQASNSFVALGDVAAASDLVSYLGQHGRSFTERFPTDMSFAEIQEHSSVLIGGFNNQMALMITKDLPYVMKGSDRIEERLAPQHSWRLQFYGDAHGAEDYALITRLFDPVTQHEVVTLGGIGQYGTQAAADFLTDAASMKAWAAGMPKGWQRKNVQVVLHVKIVDFRPVMREVLVSKVW